MFCLEGGYLAIVPEGTIGLEKMRGQKQKMRCAMDLIGFPLNSYVEPLTPNVMLFGDGAFGR